RLRAVRRVATGARARRPGQDAPVARRVRPPAHGHAPRGRDALQHGERLMLFLPGWLIALVTFPGVVVHEAAHRVFCDLTDVPVSDARYSRPGQRPAGYVLHGRPDRLWKALLISIGPLLVNTVLCALLTFEAAYSAFVLDAGLGGPVEIVLAWLGFSI